MTRTQEAVCELMKASLFGGEARLPADTDWVALCREMAEQTVLAIPGDVIAKIDMPPPLRAQWTRLIMKQVFAGMRLMTEQTALVELLEAQGIPFVILKGAAAAMYYPRPDYRRMGDVDVIVQPRDFDRTQRLIEESGYAPVSEITEETRDCPYTKNGVLFELHRSFTISAGGPQGAYLEKRIMDGVAGARVCRVMDNEFPALAQEENGLVLLQHISQHLEAGLGLRQILDWLMYVKTCLRDEEWAKFQPAARASGMETLAITVARLGQLHFGLPEEGFAWCTGADEQLCEDLLAHVFRSGDFGHKDTGSSATVNALSRSQDGFFRNLQESGCRNWQALKRHPWLKPFAWLYQLCRYVKRGLSRGSNLRALMEDLKASRRLNRMLRKLGATRHREKK